MMKCFGLIGKGGFAKEVYASMIKDRVRYTVMILNDTDGSLQRTFANTGLFNYLLCIGDPNAREKVYNQFEHVNNHLKTYVSKNASILDDTSVDIGLGSIVCAGSVITCNVRTGISTLINLNCSVGHDVTIGDFVTISPGCNISGNCRIGNKVSIGSNTVVKEHISIADNVTIGMGSVVTKDLTEPGVYVGNPCRMLK